MVHTSTLPVSEIQNYTPYKNLILKSVGKKCSSYRNWNTQQMHHTCKVALQCKFS